MSLVEELDELLLEEVEDDEVLEEDSSEEEGRLLEDSLSLELGSFSELAEELFAKLELLEEFWEGEDPHAASSSEEVARDKRTFDLFIKGIPHLGKRFPVWKYSIKSLVL